MVERRDPDGGEVDMYKILLFILFFVSVCGATKTFTRGSVTAGGWVPTTGHLQGSALNKDTIYVSFSNNVVKYNFINGDTLASVYSPSHCGGICFVDDTLYVSNVDGYVRKYDRNLVLVDSSSLAGKITQIYCIAYYNNHFYVAGTMSAGQTTQPVHKYDRNMNFVQTYTVATGYQALGTQCMEYWDGKFYMGCYGSNYGEAGNSVNIVECDTAFNVLNICLPNYAADGAYGMTVTNNAPPDSNEFIMSFPTKYWAEYKSTEGDWNPSDIPNLNHWFESDYGVGRTPSGLVSSWLNRGSDLNNAKQLTTSKQPIYTADGMGGKPTITFDGTSDYLHFTSTHLTQYTYFIVFESASLVGRRCLLEEDGNYQISVETNTTFIAAWALQTSGSANLMITGCSINTPYVVSIRFPYMDKKLDGWRQTRSTEATETNTGGNGVLPAVNGINLGTYRSEDGRFFQGKMSAVLIYEDSLTATEMGIVQDYLFEKYDAGNFYVSNDGNDSNSGMSTDYPWETLSQVNGETFVGNDSILLNKGDTFRETYIQPSSGTSGNPITFSSYETGADPVISGADLVTGWTQYSTGFVADAEDNGLADWDNSVQGGTSTIVASAGSKNNGTYGYEVTSDGSNGVYVNKEIVSIGDDIYVRGYFYLDPTWTLAGSWDEAHIISLYSAGTKRAYVQIKEDASDGYWVRARLVSPAQNLTETQITRGTWYRFEVRYVVDGSAGGLAFWLDGNASGSSLNNDTSTDTIDSVKVGFEANDFPAAADYMYFDDVKASDSAIGAYASGESVQTIYKLGISTEPEIVVIDGTVGTDTTASANVTSENEWFWTTSGDDTLFVKADPTSTIEAGQRSYCITGASKNYITVSGLSLKYANDAIVLADNSNYWTISNNTLNGAGNGDEYGIFLHADNYASADGDHTITGNTISGIRGDGIFCQRVRNITISSNTINASYKGTDGANGDNIQFLDCTDGTVTSNTLSQQGSNTVKGNLVCESPTGTTPANFTISSNEMSYGNFGVGFYRPDSAIVDGVIIRWNYIHDQIAGGQIQSNYSPSSNWQIYYNILSNGYDGINLGDIGTAKQDTLVNIYNNVISNFSRYGILAETFTGNIKNNIIWHSTGLANSYYLAAEGTIVSDNNVIGITKNGFINYDGTAYNTLSAYQAGKSQDVNSLDTDPLFTSATNFIPRNSLLNNAGVSVGLSLDYAGNTVGALPDIGAYEFGSPKEMFIYFSGFKNFMDK